MGSLQAIGGWRHGFPYLGGDTKTKYKGETGYSMDCKAEEDKKRGYGLIGKTTILHIVNSGSRPDISIFFYCIFYKFAV